MLGISKSNQSRQSMGTIYGAYVTALLSVWVKSSSRKSHQRDFSTFKNFYFVYSRQAEILPIALFGNKYKKREREKKNINSFRFYKSRRHALKR